MNINMQNWNGRKTKDRKSGIVGMGFAYPINRKVYNKVKAEYTPRILELTAELTDTI